MAQLSVNPLNNINETETIPFNEFHLTVNKKLFARQLAMAKKIVQEVNAFDNVYFEICNEPYWLRGVPGDDSPVREQQFLPEIDNWQEEISKAIVGNRKDASKEAPDRAKHCQQQS